MATYVVYKRPNSRWIVSVQTYKDGGTIRKALSGEAFKVHGFTKEMTLEQAREHAKWLTKRDKEETREKQGAADRVANEKLVHEIYLPRPLVEEFERRLEKKTFSDESLDKTMAYWKFAKVMLIELRLQPSEYASESQQMYKYFCDKEISYSYVQKVLAVVNNWAMFVCQQRNQFYAPVKNPTGVNRSRIEDAYQDGEGYQGPSDALTPEIIAATKIKNPLYKNWLNISVWFGLRPAEVDGLKDKKNWRIEHTEENDILWVYQPKLTSVPRDQRWKGIPILFKEQKAALEHIIKGELKQPFREWFAETWPGKYIRAYGGRKGFVDLMRERKQELVDISQWMGHTTVDRTWRNYMDKKKIRFTR